MLRWLGEAWSDSLDTLLVTCEYHVIFLPARAKCQEQVHCTVVASFVYLRVLRCSNGKHSPVLQIRVALFVGRTRYKFFVIIGRQISAVRIPFFSILGLWYSKHADQD